MSFQQDIIKVDGKKIFINPFLYSRKLNENTKRWLRESGQIPKSIIYLNRNKFYPDLKWEILSLNEKLLKDTTIELFIKTIELIQTFNPNLSSEQLLLVEKNLIYYKKISFEKWSKNYFLKKDRFLIEEKRKLERAKYISTLQKWLSLNEVRRLVLPFFVVIIISALIGWFAGVSKNSCNPYFESNTNNQI